MTDPSEIRERWEQPKPPWGTIAHADIAALFARIEELENEDALRNLVPRERLRALEEETDDIICAYRAERDALRVRLRDLLDREGLIEQFAEQDEAEGLSDEDVTEVEVLQDAQHEAIESARAFLSDGAP